MLSDILEATEQYYAKKIVQHGCAPQGVDWKDTASQQERFLQLTKILPVSRQYSLIDLGCGYGALFEYLKEDHHLVEYLGLDISETMVKHAKENIFDARARFSCAATSPLQKDYVLASGIFNVKLQYSNQEWESYLFSTIDKMAKMARCGFAFNILSRYSDAEYQRDDLYYACPLKLFDYCKETISPRVSILHDYPLYEFSVLVRFD